MAEIKLKIASVVIGNGDGGGGGVAPYYADLPDKPSINGGTLSGDMTSEDLGLASSEQSVPSGGTTGQVLAKKSNADNDVQWVDQQSGGQGTTNYADLDNKPQINSVALSGNKSASDLGLATAVQGGLAETAYQKPQSGIPSTDLAQDVQTSLGKADSAIQGITKGGTTLTPDENKVVEIPADITGAQATTVPSSQQASASIDENKVLQLEIPKGEDGHNPNLGTFLDTDSANWPSTNIQDGDYIIVVDNVTDPTNPTATIYLWDGDSWESSGKAADSTAFATGELLASTSIVNDLTTGGEHDALSAEQGRFLDLNWTYQQPSRGVKTATKRYFTQAAPTIVSHAENYKLHYIAVRAGDYVRIVATNSLSTYPLFNIGITTTKPDENVVVSNVIEKSCASALELYYPRITNDGYICICAYDTVNVTYHFIRSLPDENADNIDAISVVGKNKYNPNDQLLINDVYLVASGDMRASSTGAKVSGWIPFTQADDKLVISVNGETLISSLCWCVYDANFAQINGKTYSAQYYAQWEAGVAWVRFSIPANATNVQIETGQTPTEYEPYKKVIKDSAIPIVTTAKIEDGAVTLSKLHSTLSAEFTKVEIPLSAIKANSVSDNSPTLAATTRFLITDYPRYLKRCCCLSASAMITSNFAGIELGVGNDENKANQMYVVVDGANVTIYHYHPSRTPAEKKICTMAHGMTFDTFIKVTLTARGKDFIVTIATLGDIKSFSLSASTDYDYYGYPFIGTRGTTTLTDVSLNATSADMVQPIWIFGDSYVAVGTNLRWPYYLNDMGIDDYALFGLSGGTSSDLFAVLQAALEINTPKYLVWALGMNNPDTDGVVNSSWQSYFDQLVSICSTKGIELIAATIPNTPNKTNYYKNEVVKSSGLRYIDFAKSVDAEAVNSSWYVGCLSTDNEHPTAIGAQVLASQVLQDFPEIISL